MIIMAQLELLIPHILKWENGVTGSGTAEELFFRARAEGIRTVSGDKGGPTCCGVTLQTYKAYCKAHGKPAPDIAMLGCIGYREWLDILKGGAWDRWQADRIESQSVAEMLADWSWTSGGAVQAAQGVLGVRQDGIVGPKTLAAINSRSPLPLWASLKQRRLLYYQRIVELNPSQRKFLRGWTNRVNDLTWKG